MKPDRCIWLVAMLATSSAQADEALSKLAWLGGCWSADGGEAGSVEHWLPPAGGTLLGVSRSVRDGQTVAFEFMQIREQADGRLVFVAQPSGRPPTVFQLLKISATEVAFENLENDFPQRVVYASPDGQRLDAQIEGVVDGERRTVGFPMTKTDCEAAAAIRADVAR